MSYLSSWGPAASKAYESFSSVIRMSIEGPTSYPAEKDLLCFNVYAYDDNDSIVFYEMLSFKTEHEKEDVEDYIDSLGTFLGLIWDGKEYVSAN